MRCLITGAAPEELDALQAVVGAHGVDEEPHQRRDWHSGEDVRHKPR